jgi:hypothetical protein
MNNIGFYRIKSKLNKTLWRHRSYEWQISIPYLEGCTVTSLFQQIYDIGYSVGFVDGEDSKALKIKQLLNIP